jgi:pimeloyl-ACP methyl ester carboxylesterase
MIDKVVKIVNGLTFQGAFINLTSNSLKEEMFRCRPPQYHHLAPRPHPVQHWMLRLFMKGLNLILTTTRNPDMAMDAVIRLNRRLCGVRLKTRKAGSMLWPFLEGGTGEPVLLLHGFGADKDRFGSLVLYLRINHKVVIPDLPGFGDHLPDWSASYGIEDQVRRLETFANFRSAVQYHLLGISLGGYLAAYFAVRNPHLVKSLCLISSAGFSSPVVSDVWKLYQESGRNIFLCTTAQDVQDQMDYLLHRPVKLPGAVKRYWARRGVKLLAWRRKLFDDLMAGGVARMDDLAQHIKVPTLVLWGAQDRVMHVSAVDHIMSKIEDCRAYIIHGCGHIPIIEYPVLSRKLYMDFLNRIDPA